MKKKIVIILALLCVSILVFLFVKKGTTAIKTSTTPGTTTSKEEAAKTTPINTADTDQGRKCTFSTTDEKGTVSGTVYISGNKSNSVTNIKNADGVTLEVNNISDGEWMYSWVTGQSKGTKTQITAASTQSDTSFNPELESTVNETGNGCIRWTTDNSKFVLPSDIQF